MLLFACVGLAVWLYLIAFHGGFWRLTEREGDLAPGDAPAPRGLRVTAIVPARDEAAVIETSLASLLTQRFSGALDVVLVDDQSGDGTCDLARSCAERLAAADQLTVLQTTSPESG